MYRWLRSQWFYYEHANSEANDSTTNMLTALHAAEYQQAYGFWFCYVRTCPYLEYEQRIVAYLHAANDVQELSWSAHRFWNVDEGTGFFGGYLSYNHAYDRRLRRKVFINTFLFSYPKFSSPLNKNVILYFWFPGHSYFHTGTTWFKIFYIIHLWRII